MHTVVIQAIITGLMMGGVYGLLAVGMSLIIGVANIMQLAHGDLLMVGMYITLGIVTITGLDPYLSILIVLPLMALLAIFTFRGFPAIHKLIKLTSMKQMLFMLGFSYFLQNIVLVVVGSNYYTLNSVVTKWDKVIGGFYISSTRLLAGVVSLVFMAILMFVINKTDVGRSIRAASQDKDAAAMMGINPNRTYLIAWIIGVGSLGVAAPMLTSIFTFYPYIAPFWQMMAFMSVVLGGLGNIFAAVVGGFIMSVAMELGMAFLPGSMATMMPFLIFVIFLILKPEGLFGEASRGAK